MSIGQRRSARLIYAAYLRFLYFSETETSKQMKTRTDFSPIVILEKKMQRPLGKNMTKRAKHTLRAQYEFGLYFFFFLP